MADHLRQWATSVSFPELSHLPLIGLRAFAKTCAVERFRRGAKGLVDAIERNAAFVATARDGVAFAPQVCALSFCVQLQYQKFAIAREESLWRLRH